MGLYGLNNAYFQKVNNNFEPIDDLYSINGNGMNTINCLNNEIAIGRDDNGQAKMQRYDLNLNKIGDEILLSNDIDD